MNVGDLCAQRSARQFTKHNNDIRAEGPQGPLEGSMGGDAGLGTVSTAGGEVMLFGLADVVTLPGSNERGATGLLRELLTAASVRERERAVRFRLDEVGFEWLAYYTVSASAAGPARRACFMSCAQVEWTKRYLAQSYHEVDPRHELTRRSSLPLVWDEAWIEDALGERVHSPRVRGFLDELRDSGLGSGVFVRVPAKEGAAGETAVVSLGASTSTRRWIDDKVLGEALVLALSLHDYLSNHVQFPVAEAAADACRLHATGLPARQQAVLRHVAHGLTDRAIAQQLGVSLHTVDYYLRQLRQHFAVHNRVQLISAAAHLLE